MALGSTVIVPLASPDTVGALTTVAAAVAAHDAGRVVPVTVLPRAITSQRRAEAGELVLQAERAARAHGVSATGLVVQASSVPSGIRSVVAAHDASLVVMGWRGPALGDNVFGRLIDELVGRTSVPLVLLRPGPVQPRRVVLAVDADHLRAGGRGVELATALARRLGVAGENSVAVVTSGAGDGELPEELRQLSDRTHHDPRRLTDAVASASRAGDVVVTPVAPTARGLRQAARHLAFAAPEAALLVSLDAGPTRSTGLADAAAGSPRTRREGEVGPRRVVVTISAPPGTTVPTRDLVRALTPLGDVAEVDVWWAVANDRQHVRTSVRLLAAGPNAAVGEIMVALHETPALSGFDIRYDLVPEPRVLAVDELTPMGSTLEDY